jgi:predicted amidohydrolase
MSESEDSTVRKGQGPKVAIAQIDPKLGDLDANMETHREAIAKAKADGADLLVFPELSLTGYRLKDSVPEVALTKQCPELLELSDLSKDMAIVAGFVLESSEHFFFNCAAYFEDGRVSFVHRKVYLPTYGMFDEQRYFARGRRLQAFGTKHGRAAILVCEDMLHPSAVTIAALDGAGLIIVPSASPARGVAESGEVDANGRAWESYNRVMASTYGLFVVHANRAGVEDGHTFWGGSEIVGPSGETLAKAAYYQADFVSAVLPASLQRRQRLQAPVLRDEDVDMTVNELCRIRGREKPAGAEQRPQRGDAPPYSQDRQDRNGGRQDRNDRQDRPDRNDRQDRRYGGGGGGQQRFGRGRGGPPPAGGPGAGGSPGGPRGYGGGRGGDRRGGGGGNRWQGGQGRQQPPPWQQGQGGGGGGYGGGRGRGGNQERDDNVGNRLDYPGNRGGGFGGRDAPRDDYRDRNDDFRPREQPRGDHKPRPAADLAKTAVVRDEDDSKE